MVIFLKVIYRLYEIRTERKLTVRDLEQLTGVSKSTISRIEQQDMNPSVMTICQIAVALNISPYELFYIEKQ